MDANQFFIPKQTDESLIKALGVIRDEFEGFGKLFIRVNTHYNGTQVDVNEKEPATCPAIQFVISEQSELMPYFYLIDNHQQQQKTALVIRRQPDKLMDHVTIQWNEWAVGYPEGNRSKLFVKLMGLARKHLRAIEVEASLGGLADNEWTRYRDSQQAILNSLEETAKSVITESGRRNLETQVAADARIGELEKALRVKWETEHNRLTAEHDQKLQDIGGREKALTTREAEFNTKEARYVARQGQQGQIEAITKWLDGWSLTRGTTNKWWSVAGIYCVALLMTLGVTIWFGVQSYLLLDKLDLAQAHWWQLGFLSVKPILPLAAFITFLVYAVRWFSSWSTQHAQEEFRNRARLLDIGRSGWLLEAVRDAQDNKRELPPELLKELSRNLFAYSAAPDGSDLYPEAITDLLTQGITSLRVKAHDGSEVEAKRGKEK